MAAAGGRTCPAVRRGKRIPSFGILGWQPTGIRPVSFAREGHTWGIPGISRIQGPRQLGRPDSRDGPSGRCRGRIHWLKLFCILGSLDSGVRKTESDWRWFVSLTGGGWGRLVGGRWASRGTGVRVRRKPEPPSGSISVPRARPKPSLPGFGSHCAALRPPPPQTAACSPPQAGVSKPDLVTRTPHSG